MLAGIKTKLYISRTNKYTLASCDKICDSLLLRGIPAYIHYIYNYVYIELQSEESPKYLEFTTMSHKLWSGHRIASNVLYGLPISYLVNYQLNRTRSCLISQIPQQSSFESEIVINVSDCYKRGQ